MRLPLRFPMNWVFDKLDAWAAPRWDWWPVTNRKHWSYVFYDWFWTAYVAAFLIVVTLGMLLR